MPPVSLNIDLGELPEEPEELYALATVVNVACGGHAGDEASMARAVERARWAGARVAAHPSYPDRAGFGRTSMAIPPERLRQEIAEQCAALVAVANRAGVSVSAVKPHGALYHDASRDGVIAAAVLEGAREALGALTLVGPPQGELQSAALAQGVTYVREGFADRAYLPDGGLVPRTQAGALLTVPADCAAQALRLAASGRYETLCVHSDTPGAPAIARAVRDALAQRHLLARG
jgi:UPF0271 protein